MQRATVARVSEGFDTGIFPSDLDPERPRPLETPWGSFSLFVAGGSVRAAQSFCPHLGGPLFQGTMQGDVIMCPWHLWCFSLTSGARVDFLGKLVASSARIAVLPVGVSETGTIVLGPPADSLSPDPYRQ
jgi:nitrite reductase/ring-hydroxylating ferredoxin subunit